MFFSRRNPMHFFLRVTFLLFSSLLYFCGKGNPVSSGNSQDPANLAKNIIVTPILKDTIPTAFINFLAKTTPDDAGGLVQVYIQNTNKVLVQLRVEGQVEGYTNNATKMVTIAAGLSDTIKLAPLITNAAFQSLSENKTVSYRVITTLISGITETQVYNQTHTAQMLAKDVFIFGDSQLDKLIALWVTPHIRQVDQLIAKAIKRNPENAFIGYQNSPTSDGYQHISTPYSGTCTVTAGRTATAKTFTLAYYYANPKISGSFTATGGRGDDIKASIVDSLANNYYQSGKVHTDNFILSNLVSGTYHYKFDNSFSLITDKSVTYTLNVSYDKDWIYVQTKAIYDALKNDYKISYVNSSISYPNGTQKIRLPTDALSLGSANCIDGTVLFASALENISLEPIICLIPGHAFVGWKRWTGAIGKYEFLETTMIGSSTYEEAYKKGLAEFTQYRNTKSITIIDVKACRDIGITPLMKSRAR